MKSAQDREKDGERYCILFENHVDQWKDELKDISASSCRDLCIERRSPVLESSPAFRSRGMVHRKG